MNQIDRGIPGKRIAARRRELGMTQDELGKAAGYKNFAGINKLELGKNQPSLAVLENIASVLGVSPIYLAGWTDVQKPEEEKIVKHIVREEIIEVPNLPAIDNAILTVCRKLTDNEKNVVLDYATRLLR